MYHLTLQTELPVAPEHEEAIRQAAAAALTHQNVSPPVGLTILLADDDTLHQLNRDYRGVDGPTDVLSFPLAAEQPGSGVLYLGDIAISVPYADRQAAAEGHPLLAELQLLTVHALLHLLGYDHTEPQEKADMWAAQAEILHSLGSALTNPPDEEG
ncbi:MAG: rRNA maturation RNase YbeY [Anaerolineae bacterium]|nr:rRNA maturation RNase YbeY [Anaerolineae bacterium]